MALGTATITRPAKGPLQPLFGFTMSFLCDNSYPTGGYQFDTYVTAQLGTDNNDALPVGVTPNDCGGYVPVYVPSTGKLKIYYADYDAVADGPLIEVPDTTDLSAVTLDLLVHCK